MTDVEVIEVFLSRYRERVQMWTDEIRLSDTCGQHAEGDGVSGSPCLVPGEIPVVSEMAEKVLAGIVSDLQQAAKVSTDDLTALLDAHQGRRLPAAPLVLAVLAGDGAALQGLAQAAGLEVRLLDFIAPYLARPFLAAELGGYRPDEARFESFDARCPGCGGEAVLGFFMPDTGQRRLWCRWCGTHWPVARLRCPFCHNEEKDTLGYFTVDDRTDRRVDICRKCLRYVKMVDLRVTGGQDPTRHADLQDLLTADLDETAVQEGFLSSTE